MSDDFTIGEMEVVNSMFFGVNPEDIAHISITIQTVRGEVRTLGCIHAKELAELTLQMKAVNRNVQTNAFYPRAHDDGNVDSPSGNKRQSRMARILSYLQFRTQIRYR